MTSRESQISFSPSETGAASLQSTFNGLSLSQSSQIYAAPSSTQASSGVAQVGPSHRLGGFSLPSGSSPFGGGRFGFYGHQHPLLHGQGQPMNLEWLVERQAICRAYKIGQKKVVYTYHLMTLGTTEVDKYCRQVEKERLSELVFTSSLNETNKEKPSSSSAACIADSFLEEMVDHPRLKGMFEKIINQPKDANLIETFGVTS